MDLSHFGLFDLIGHQTARANRARIAPAADAGPTGLEPVRIANDNAITPAKGGIKKAGKRGRQMTPSARALMRGPLFRLVARRGGEPGPA